MNRRPAIGGSRHPFRPLLPFFEERVPEHFLQLAGGAAGVHQRFGKVRLVGALLLERNDDGPFSEPAA
jgi:hypothetical protein